MLRQLRSLKVLAFVVVAIGAIFAGEMSQAVAEGFLAEAEAQMTGLVNEHRTEHGHPALATNEALRMVARRQAQRMVMAGYIYHNPDLGKEATEAVPGWLLVGENVGVGPSVSLVQQAFLDSPKHHENIDTARFNALGLGAMANDQGDMYFTQNFADLKAQAAPVARPPVQVLPKKVSVATTAPRPAAPQAPRPVATPFVTPPPAPVATPVAVAPTPQPPSPEVRGTQEQAPQTTLVGGLGAMLGRFFSKLAFWK